MAVRMIVPGRLVRGVLALVEMQRVCALPFVRDGARLQRHVLLVEACVSALRGVPDHPLQNRVALLQQQGAREPARPLFACIARQAPFADFPLLPAPPAPRLNLDARDVKRARSPPPALACLALDALLPARPD
jgi:hypothetical protein